MWAHHVPAAGEQAADAVEIDGLGNVIASGRGRGAFPLDKAEAQGDAARRRTTRSS
jgi:hypothetical protein